MKPTRILLLVLLALLSSRPHLHAAEENPAAKKKVRIPAISAGWTVENATLGKKQSTLDYDVERQYFFVGSERGTRWYDSRYETKMDKNSATHRFKTALHMEESGFFFGSRFVALPGHAFAVGFGQKEVRTDPYLDYLLNQVTGVWTPTLTGWGNITSNPFHFTWDWQPRKTWRVSAGLDRETAAFTTVSSRFYVRTNVLTLGVAREWPKADFGVSYSSYSSSSNSTSGSPNGNSHLRVSAAYKPWPFLRLFTHAGVYKSGVPLAGDYFSDIGQQFIFTYMGGGEPGINPVFQEKFGYYSVGVSFVFKTR